MAHNDPAIQKILEDRYYLRDEQGNLLEKSPEEMFARVAVAIAKAEQKGDNIVGSAESYWQHEFFQLMVDNKL
jgi:ribonucleotide reductase alpha subunit